MKSIIYIILGMFLSISSYAEIHEAYSVAEIKKWTCEADENTLVIFDMDYTLVMPKNPAFHRPNSWKYLNWLIDLQEQLTPEDWQAYVATLMLSDPLILVEQELPQFIDEIKNNKSKVIVLTKSPAGTIGENFNIEDTRNSELKRLGIDISNSFANLSPTIFKEFSSKNDFHPTFKHGILLTNECNKGDLLKAFLDKSEWTPSKVIFIDDKLSNLNTVEKMLFSSDIEYYGIHYRKAEFADTVSLSEEVIKNEWKKLNRKTKLITHNKTDQNYVVIHGSKFTLELYDSNHDLIKVYPIGLGKNGLGKTEEGDCKTPVGEYQILWKASRYWESDGGFPIIEGYSYCRHDNTYVYSSRTVFHGALWKDDYGGNDAVFMCLDYPNKSDLSKEYTGDGIAIHASLLGGIEEFSSKGCIRMVPNDARDLYNRLNTGAIVFIEVD